ncbi:MAG: hypothetical protein ACXVZ2_04115 [Gaiellaceae bacterium]
MPDFLADAEACYLAACERRHAIWSAWIAEDSPLLSVGSTGQPIEHPLVRMLRDHDLLVDRLAAAAKVRHRGPVPSAVPGLPAPLERVR